MRVGERAPFIARFNVVKRENKSGDTIIPHAALRLLPGTDQNKTPALNEAAISSCNLIRFVPDRNGAALPQKLGGWSRWYPNQMPSAITALWPWADSDAQKHLAVGMVGGLSTIDDGASTSRSPRFYEYSTAVDFSTTADNAEVDIGDVGSNVKDTDSVLIMTPVSVGGIILFGLYSAIAQSADQYSIDSVNVIGLPLPAVSTVANGGAVPVFDTTNGSSSVLVTLADHSLSVGVNFSILVPTTVGGITIGVGNYTVQTVPSDNTFTILVDGVATSTDNEPMNGGEVKFRYYLGHAEAPISGGYGTGGYGRGGYGAGITTGVGRVFDTTAASGVGNVATISFAENFAIPVGSKIIIAGVTPLGFNGNWTVTASTAGSPSTVSFDSGSPLTGPQTVAGTVTITQFAFVPVLDWTLDNWGGDLIACPRNGAVYVWSPLDGGAEATIVPNAPTNNEGALVAMPQRQIIAYGSTFNDIQDPLLVRWCDINDYSDWIANATNQAGSFRLSNGSKIMSALQASGSILLWTDLSLWSMQYVSLPGVYGFNEIASGCGLIGRKAAAKLGGSTYWMSQSQFFKLSGGGAQPFPCSVWDVIFQDIDPDYYDEIRAAPNSRFGEVSWYYPTIGSGGIPTKYVKYNTLCDAWDYGTLTRTSWVDQSVFGPPLASDDNRYIMQHEISNDADGEAMSSSFTTGFFALSEGNELTFVDQLWPDMKWALYGDSGSGVIQITFHVAEYAGSGLRRYGPYSVTRETKYITLRFRARLVSIEVSSDDVGSWWRLGLMRYRFSADGRFL